MNGVRSIVVSMPPCHGGEGVQIPRIPLICSKSRVTSVMIGSIPIFSWRKPREIIKLFSLFLRLNLGM